MPLRAARPSDASSIAVLSIEVWMSTYLKKGVNALFAEFVLGEFTQARTLQFLSDPDQFVMVSENEEGIDGFIRVTPHSKDPVDGASDVEISTFYVQPRHHGKGIGSQLLDAALDHCCNLDAGTVWLATNAENDPAIAFYLARGFEHIGETHFQIADESYLNNVYRYRL